jgi:outer membrane protein W
MAAFGLLLQSPIASAQSNDTYLIAQNDPEEAFDPFSDYSEFDEASDEEADINFFRNGRFFTVGVLAGSRNFTGNFAKQYGQSTAFGLSISYFFDLRSAFALSFITGDHSVNFTTNSGAKTYSGNVSLTSLNFDFKYYFNTQNVSRGVADLNPYGILGFAQYYRTYSLDNFEGASRDATMGAELGAGVEIPLMRKKAYLGVQGTYHMVNFADESKEFVGSERLDSTLSGDYYNLLLILGMNF